MHPFEYFNAPSDPDVIADHDRFAWINAQRVLINGVAVTRPKLNVIGNQVIITDDDAIFKLAANDFRTADLSIFPDKNVAPRILHNNFECSNLNIFINENRIVITIYPDTDIFEFPLTYGNFVVFPSDSYR